MRAELQIGGKLSERDVYSIMAGKVDGQLVVPAAQVLHEGAPGREVRSDGIVLSPRIGLSRALSRP